MTAIPNTIAGTALSAATSGVDATGARLKGAAQQFEAIFVRQMLSSARQAGFGDELFGSGAVDTFREMQDSKIADMVAQTGTLGLAKQIEAQMSRLIGTAADAATGAVTGATSALTDKKG
ncbi:MAG: rod-binding protein [Novosphingobium sp.]